LGEKGRGGGAVITTKGGGKERWRPSSAKGTNGKKKGETNIQGVRVRHESQDKVDLIPSNKSTLGKRRRDMYKAEYERNPLLKGCGSLK